MQILYNIGQEVRAYKNGRKQFPQPFILDSIESSLAKETPF